MNRKKNIRIIIAIIFIYIFTNYGDNLNKFLYNKINYVYQLISLISILCMFLYDNIIGTFALIIFFLQIKLVTIEEFIIVKTKEIKNY